MDEFEKWLDNKCNSYLGEEAEYPLNDVLDKYRSMTCKILTWKGSLDWCSACDYRGMYDTMNYCPNCGRRVQHEE